MRRGGLRKDLRERRTWRTRVLGLSVRWTDCGEEGGALDYYDVLVSRRLPAFSPTARRQINAAVSRWRQMPLAYRLKSLKEEERDHDQAKDLTDE